MQTLLSLRSNNLQESLKNNVLATDQSKELVGNQKQKKGLMMGNNLAVQMFNNNYHDGNVNFKSQLLRRQRPEWMTEFKIFTNLIFGTKTSLRA